MSRFQSNEAEKRLGQDIELSYPFFAELAYPQVDGTIDSAPREDRVVKTGLETFSGAPASAPFQLHASEDPQAVEGRPDVRPVSIPSVWLEAIRYDDHESAAAMDDRDSVRLFLQAVSMVL